MNHRVSIHTPGRLTVLAALLAGFAAPAIAAQDSPIVISQIFGAGGNSGAKIKNDYIELFNRSADPVSVDGWSVQYASASGTSWQVTKLTGSILPGQYFLVGEALGNGGDTDLPAPEVSGSIPMAGGAGKVALSKTATALTGAVPTSASLMDLVGFGTGSTSANGFEGAGPTPTLSSTLAAFRKDGGCTDTNDNAADFGTATPAPRNSHSPFTQCAGAGPIPQPIVAACPASIWNQAGSPIEGVLKASDADSIVNAASITFGARAGISLVPQSVPQSAGGTAEFALQVADTLPAGTYTVGVTFTNDASQSASCNVAVKVAGSHTIPQIQGPDAASPYNNSVQTIEGVLTAKVGSGFFIQDLNGDGDPNTSDGIFVFGPRTDALPGELVRVTGTVSEYTPTGATRSYTELKDVLGVSRLGGSYSIAPTNIELPNNDLGRFEGMLVHFTTPLTVNSNSYLGDRGELVLSYGRREQPTNRYAPRTAEAAALAAENAKNVVVLDDGIFVNPDTVPYLGENGTVRVGDLVTNLTGVLDYGAAGGIDPAFKLQPTEAPSISRTNPRTDAPEIAPGNIKVASANVLNFFTTFTNGNTVFGETGQGCSLGSGNSKSNCRGADNLQEFERQRDKIVAELKAIDADAVGLMEIQNNGEVAVGYLVDQLNAAIGSPVYAVVPYSGPQSTDAIRTAMIYKPAKLSLVGPALSDANSINNRAPLAQTFKAANGAKFSLIVNHLRAKGSCNASGGAANADTDGQGCWNGQRLQQVQRLFDYLIPQVKAASGDDDILLVGDMNSYAMEDPIKLFTSNGMVNEVERFVRPQAMPHSYVFDALSGYLDHALATPSLDAQMAGVSEWHNNADEPDAIDYNLGDTTQDLYAKDAFRASDHDPVVISLNLAPAFADVTASVKTVVNGLAMNRLTGKFSGTVSFTNTSGTAINGPLQFVLQGLSANASLDGKSGDYNGSPYVTLPNASIAAGATVTVTTTFTNPTRATISYTPKLYSGAF
jgi:predicted extracellular nuclease